MTGVQFPAYSVRHIGTAVEINDGKACCSDLQFTSIECQAPECVDDLVRLYGFVRGFTAGAGAVTSRTAVVSRYALSVAGRWAIDCCVFSAGLALYRAASLYSSRPPPVPAR